MGSCETPSWWGQRGKGSGETPATMAGREEASGHGGVGAAVGSDMPGMQRRAGSGPVRHGRGVWGQWGSGLSLSAGLGAKPQPRGAKPPRHGAAVGGAPAVGCPWGTGLLHGVSVGRRGGGQPRSGCQGAAAQPAPTSLCPSPAPARPRFGPARSRAPAAAAGGSGPPGHEGPVAPRSSSRLPSYPPPGRTCPYAHQQGPAPGTRH